MAVPKYSDTFTDVNGTHIIDHISDSMHSYIQPYTTVRYATVLSNRASQNSGNAVDTSCFVTSYTLSENQVITGGFHKVTAGAFFIHARVKTSSSPYTWYELKAGLGDGDSTYYYIYNHETFSGSYILNVQSLPHIANGSDNTFELSIIGSAFSLTVNGILIGTGTDSSISGTGGIGFNTPWSDVTMGIHLDYLQLDDYIIPPINVSPNILRLKRC